MKKMYGLEPDLCIENSKWILENPNDIILPEYFYSQLEYLQNGNFSEATDTASLIIDSLDKQEYFKIFVFKNRLDSKIYFVNQEVAFKLVDSSSNIDITVPVNRYLVTLFFCAGLLKSQVEFLALSPNIVKQCQELKFEIANSDHFLIPSERWLEPKVIGALQIRLDPLGQMQWEEDTSETNEQTDSIQWIDFRI